MGQWYEAYRADVIYEVGSTCVNATYTLNADGSVHVLNQAINFLGQFSNIEGTATVKNASEPAAFDLVFNARKCWTFLDPILFFFFIALKVQKGEYNVITSDYTQYSLVYACRIIPVVNVKLDFIWMLSCVIHFVKKCHMCPFECLFSDAQKHYLHLFTTS